MHAANNLAPDSKEMGKTYPKQKQTFQQTRREFIQLMLGQASLLTLAGFTLMNPRPLMAGWPRKAFNSYSVDTALDALHGTTETSEKKYGTVIKARPHLNAGETQVTVSITTKIPHVESITILAKNNHNPLVASFTFKDKNVESLITRIKMDGKGDLIAILKSGENLYSQTTTVDFSGCGCG